MKTDSVNEQFFQSALPVWAAGMGDEMNYFLRFRTSIPSGEAKLVLAACSVYRVFVNGQFFSSGPARTAHGYCRVDRYSLNHLLKEKDNEIVIEVGAYRVNSFEYLDEPGFLQCEIVSGKRVLAATGVSGFFAETMGEKVQKVQRYSFQRTFCEEYILPARGKAVELDVVPARKLLERGVPYYCYDKHEIREAVCTGSVKDGIKREQYVMERYIVNISPEFKGYAIGELDSFVQKEVLEMDFFPENEGDADRSVLRDHQYRIYDGKINRTGFLCTEVETDKDTILYMIFDEILTEGDIQFTRLTSANVVKYRLHPGTHILQTFEPYTLRYLKLVSLGGDCRIKDLHMKQVRNSGNMMLRHTGDECVDEIYRAAVETFCQNAVDIFMDCPSRERAGWLCDSFFLGRVEYFLTGENIVERNFLENYLLPESFSHIPDGMVPMCYPADHTDGVYIPNWAMWLVLELEEYRERSGDSRLTDAFRPKVEKLLSWFQTFENEDGLLEDLDGWVFVEWSKCNELTDGVNYPTNMLYAQMLETAGRLYGDAGMRQRAEAVRREIRKQAFQNGFFVEHGIRIRNQIVPQPDVTETCQYYAFFFGTADPDRDRELWKTLLEDFGPDRKQTNKYESVFFSNAFIGNYLRLCLLKKYGYQNKVTEEIKKYFGYMDEKTHTLWEHDSVKASCNHGFASYVACLLAEDW